MNDASLSFEPETSVALGFGFRCGFLGLLHMDIMTTRLEREFDLNLVTTAPSVIYKVVKHNGQVLMIDNPNNAPRYWLIIDRLYFFSLLIFCKKHSPYNFVFTKNI